MSEHLDNIIHALDDNFRSVCGSVWTFGRIIKDFFHPIEQNSYDLKRCETCISLLEERKK